MSHPKAVMVSSEGGYLSNLKVVHSESTQKALKEHLKSTQRAIRDQESNQTLSYRRSLKYFVLLDRVGVGVDGVSGKGRMSVLQFSSSTLDDGFCVMLGVIFC